VIFESEKCLGWTVAKSWVASASASCGFVFGFRGSPRSKRWWFCGPEPEDGPVGVVDRSEHHLTYRRLKAASGAVDVRHCLHQGQPSRQGIRRAVEQLEKTYKHIVYEAMRKLLHLVYGVAKSGKPFDPQISLAGC